MLYTFVDNMRIVLNIPGELTDLNAYIKALNGNRFTANTIKRKETERVAMEARIARLPAIQDYPVTITYRWYSKNKRKDIDNVAFSKKFINDGLVTAGVLEDDSRKYISGFTDEFYVDDKNPRVEVLVQSRKA